jgi:hypothetical protein
LVESRLALELQWDRPGKAGSGRWNSLEVAEIDREPIRESDVVSARGDWFLARLPKADLPGLK